jgi:5-methylcytosine-specific restriction enzyme subunit McrC
VITLEENGSGGRTSRLDPETATRLQATGLVDVRVHGAGEYLLLPRGKVGAVHVDGHDVVVTPKVGIARLLFLLGYAADPGFRPDDVQGVQHDDLWPAFAEILARTVERALARGALQGYTSQDAALTVVRGRIRVGDQITRRPGRVLPLEVTYDEYTTDIPENQLLRAALRRMLQVPGVTGPALTRLRHLDNRLDDVTHLTAGTPLPTWLPHQLNAHYHPALTLAEIVLRSLSCETGTGRRTTAAFVVDMWRVFENFVTTALRAAWSTRAGETRAQYPTRLYVDQPNPMQVDVVHTVDNTPRIVIDAKYKLTSPTADHYQALAYCTALKVDHAWLVHSGSEEESTTRRVLNSPVHITQHALDLSATPQHLLDQVARLADDAWTTTRRPPR